MIAAHPYPSAFTIPEAKVASYLLNLDSGDGAAKANLMRFGFSPNRPLELMDALGRHPSPTRWAAAFDASHGIKHYFEGPLLNPDDSSTAKFVTIRPVPRPAGVPE